MTKSTMFPDASPLSHPRGAAGFAKVLAAALPFLMGGCATRSPMEAWQQQVSDYVSEQGHGDPNVLRNLADARCRGSERPGRLFIGELGVLTVQPSGATATFDVHGVVLGHQKVRSQNWFVFLVGVVRQGSLEPPIIEAVHVAAMSVDGEQHHWRVSEADAAMTRKYAVRTANGKDSTVPPPAQRVFPLPSDRYRLLVNGDVLHVHEDESASHWSCSLAGTD